MDAKDMIIMPKNKKNQKGQNLQEMQEMQEAKQKQERKMQKALNDVIKILDHHCDEGGMDSDTHDTLLEEMKRIFKNTDSKDED